MVGCFTGFSHLPVTNKSGALKTVDTRNHLVPVEAKHTCQLLDGKSPLVANEGQDHKIAHFDAVVFHQFGQRATGTTESFERLFRNRRLKLA